MFIPESGNTYERSVPWLPALVMAFIAFPVAENSSGAVKKGLQNAKLRDVFWTGRLTRLRFLLAQTWKCYQ